MNIANHGARVVLAVGALMLAGIAPPPPAAAAPDSPQSQQAPATIPLGLAYASDGVNASIFRVAAVVSGGGHQFATYYDPDGNVVVARRDLPSQQWDLAVEPFKGNVKDAHNDVVLGISGDGLLHISYNHHNNPLHYRVSAKPYDIRSFGPEQAMTGEQENSVSYPEFLSAPDGTLYFFYRDGASGNGNMLLNRYDVAEHKWSVVAHPLVDGENKCNPYLWRPAIGADNSIHIAWCWRDTPNAETNHDLCYARSKDGGRTWLRSDGKPQAIPITQENAEVVDPIPQNSNLINQCSAAVDPDGHPHLVEYFNDDQGCPQYFDIWFDGSQWHRNQVSHRTSKFSLNGSGSLKISISRPEIAIGHSGTVCIITRDAHASGNGIRLYESAKPFEQWKAVDLTQSDLGNWEPSYDQEAARLNDTLDLFVLPVEQGNHEHTTDFPPQRASIVQTPLP